MASGDGGLEQVGRRHGTSVGVGAGVAEQAVQVLPGHWMPAQRPA